MSPKLVVMVALTVPSDGASASGASTSRAGSWPSDGYSQVVVAPPAAGALDSEADSELEADGVSLEVSLAVSEPSLSLPQPARERTDRQAATAAARVRAVVVSMPTTL